MSNKENNELLKHILNTRYFNLFRADMNSDYKRAAQLELYLTSHCNLKCTYCYLNKFGHKLFPTNATNFEAILKNIRMLLQYFLDEGFSFGHIDLFSGEVWGDTLGNGTLDLILEFLSKGLIIESIMIPTNFTFLLHEEKQAIMEEYIQKFRDAGSCIQLSASIDGKLLEDTTRPFKDVTKDGVVKYRDDEFYHNLFTFCRKYNFLFHPMVAAHGIEKWIDNYKWYKENMIKYGFPQGVESIMMLEVRNGDWTAEKIDEYIKFLDFVIDDRIKDEGSAENLAKAIFNIDQCSSPGYLPYGLPLSENCMPCTVQSQLTVRCGDLAMVACHRMAYDNFVFGRFTTEDDKITDIEAVNVELATKVMLTNPMNSIHGCDTCLYKKICMKGCFGAQFEFAEEPFMPISSVCDLFKRKLDFLLHKYEKTGMMYYIQKYANSRINLNYLNDTLAEYHRVMEESKKCQN